MSEVKEEAESGPAGNKHKSWPAWRVILTDFVIVVLGVGVALAAQQGEEWWRWRDQVAQARGAIATEMAQNVAGAIIRLRTQGCIERRLDELIDIVDTASRSGQLPPVGVIGQPPLRTWRSGAWDSVVAAETAAHFPRQHLANLGSLYQLVVRMESTSLLNLQAWSELYPMVGPGRRLDPASEADLRKALSLARAVNRSYASQSLTLIERTYVLKLPFSSSDLNQIADAKSVSLMKPAVGVNPDQTSAICSPIGAVPPRYGQAQFAPTPAVSEQALKNLPDFGAP
ncbi:MAG TPA: hypothetical protein VFI23_11745 [Rhizomicrobium sp.]|nr:hypothetical protein [Rhizomicrobium sp.]